MSLIGNKKAWIKIVEAFVGILLITIVVLIVVGGDSSDEEVVSSTIYNSQLSILRDIQLDSDLRNEVVGTSGTVEWTDENFPSETKTRITDKTPDYLECEAKICDPSTPCLLTEQQEEDVYAESVLISSDLTFFNPRVLKLFCWEV